MMIEVFKTNVKHADHAKILVDQIHTTFADYTANFDLEDCDRILRVVSPVFIHNGYVVLPDEKPVNVNSLLTN